LHYKYYYLKTYQHFLPVGNFKKFICQKISVHIKSLLLFALFLTTGIQVVFAQRTVRLEDYFENARTSNPQMNDYQNQIEIARLENQKIDANYRISNVYAAANWMEAPLINHVDYDPAITNGGMYSAIIGAQLPLLAGHSIHVEKKMNLRIRPQKSLLTNFARINL